MKQRGFIAAILAASLLAGTAATIAAQAQGGQAPGPRAGMRGGPGERGLGGFGFPGLRQLDLADAQREQIRKIVESHRDETQQIMERRRTAERELRLASEGQSVNEADIRAKANTLATAIADSTIHQAKVNAEIFNVLTSEQQEKLKAWRSEMEERMKNRASERGERRKRQGA